MLASARQMRLFPSPQFFGANRAPEEEAMIQELVHECDRFGIQATVEDGAVAESSVLPLDEECRELFLVAFSRSGSELVNRLKQEEAEWRRRLSNNRGFRIHCVLIGSWIDEAVRLELPNASFTFAFGSDDEVAIVDSCEFDRPLLPEEIRGPSDYGPQQARKVTNLGRGSQLLVLENADHFLWSEERAESARRVLAHLNESSCLAGQATFSANAERFSSSSVHKTAGLAESVRRRFSGAIRIADVGCGAGHWGRQLHFSGDQLTYIDPSSRMLELCHENARVAGIPDVRAFQVSGCEIDKTEGPYDLVTTRLAFHHFPDPIAVLRSMAGALAPGGQVVLLDLAPPEDDRMRRIHDRLEYLHDPSHIRTWTRAELERWFEEMDMETEVVSAAHLESPEGIEIERWFSFTQTSSENQKEIRRMLTEFDRNELESLGFSRQNNNYRYHARSLALAATRAT